jgi:hypothetical protein
VSTATKDCVGGVEGGRFSSEDPNEALWTSEGVAMAIAEVIRWAITHPRIFSWEHEEGAGARNKYALESDRIVGEREGAFKVKLIVSRRVDS